MVIASYVGAVRLVRFFTVRKVENFSSAGQSPPKPQRQQSTPTQNGVRPGRIASPPTPPPRAAHVGRQSRENERTSDKHVAGAVGPSVPLLRAIRVRDASSRQGQPPRLAASWTIRERLCECLATPSRLRAGGDDPWRQVRPRGLTLWPFSKAFLIY